MNTQDPSVSYASIDKRFLALLIDGLILVIPCGVAGRVLPYAGGVIVALLYSPILESSKVQATVGKYLMGIQVVDQNGGRIFFSTGIVRYLMKIVSSMMCFLGYVLALFSERKQTLHDLVAGTVVIDGKSEEYLADAWIAQLKSVFSVLKTSGEELTRTAGQNGGRPSSTDLSALERLHALREKGALTEEEYKREKQKILDGAKF